MNLFSHEKEYIGQNIITLKALVNIRGGYFYRLESRVQTNVLIPP
jgi:hypothetical protein